MDPVFVHLVRHGEVHNPDGLVYGDIPGFDLSETGRRQAAQAATYLAPHPITEVWASPLQRALRTAELVASPHLLPIRVDPDLIEWRLDSWTGIPWSALPVQRVGELEAYRADPTDLPFASESLDHLAARVSSVIIKTLGNAAGDVVVIGHQDPLQAARLRLTGNPAAAQHQDKPGHCSVITLAQGDPWREVGHWRPQG